MDLENVDIRITLLVADTVTQDEWKPAYEKTLQFLETMPVLEIVQDTHKRRPWRYAVPTQERETSEGLCWCAEGDSQTRHSASPNRLYRQLPECRSQPGTDVLLAVLDSEATGKPWELCAHRAWKFWGNETKGDWVHMYLLAVACLLEDLLPGKVTCTGDITRGQYRVVMPWVSSFLGRQVAEPVRCSPTRLWERISAMPVSEEERPELLAKLFIGEPDAEYGAVLREYLSTDSIDALWRKEFAGLTVTSMPYRIVLGNYLQEGFAVRDLKKCDCFCDPDGTPRYDLFVHSVLDTKMFIPGRNARARGLAFISKEAEKEKNRCMWMYLRGSIIREMYDSLVDRYMPLRDILEEIEECVGEQCNVRDVAAEWLEVLGYNMQLIEAEEEVDEEEAEEAETEEEVTEEEEATGDEAADIRSCSQFLSYRSGQSISHDLAESLIEYFAMLQKSLHLANPEVRKLLTALPPDEMFDLLLPSCSPKILLMKDDWERIRLTLEANPDSFPRYAALADAYVVSWQGEDFARALMLNDDLYAWCERQLPWWEKYGEI